MLGPGPMTHLALVSNKILCFIRHFPKYFTNLHVLLKYLMIITNVLIWDISGTAKNMLTAQAKYKQSSLCWVTGEAGSLVQDGEGADSRGVEIGSGLACPMQNSRRGPQSNMAKCRSIRSGTDIARWRPYVLLIERFEARRDRLERLQPETTNVPGLFLLHFLVVKKTRLDPLMIRHIVGRSAVTFLSTASRQLVLQTRQLAQ